MEHYGIAGCSASRALWDNGIAQWVEHYGIVGSPVQLGKALSFSSLVANPNIK